MSEWESWIGREETRHDRGDEAQVARWLATLDREAPADGSVPQAFHWCLCLPDAPTAALGTDGHPASNESLTRLLPQVTLPRRMWVASNVVFVRPTGRGQTIIRKSRVDALSEKTGNSGHLVFADVAHETYADGVLSVRETQTIVFREAPALGAPATPPPLREAQFDTSGWGRRIVSWSRRSHFFSATLR
jgi:3-methylfumaryl-CoA hydratase